MLSTAQIREIIGRISYRDWCFDVVQEPDGLFLRVRFETTCAQLNNVAVMRGRKWYLSPYTSASELVCTALKAVLTAEEHEAREFFTYKGRAIFNPHWDVEKLWEIRTPESLDPRPKDSRTTKS